MKSSEQTARIHLTATMFAVLATVMAALSAALESWVRFPLLGAAISLLMLAGVYLGLGLRTPRQK